MDYGHANQAPNHQQDFFTAGVGLAPENTNPLEPSYNIDSGEFAPQHQAVNEHSIRSGLGRVAMANQEPSVEQAVDVASDFYNLPPGYMPESAPNLGQITNLETPPLVDDAQSTHDSRVRERHFADAKINQNDIAYIKSVEEKLAQDGDIEGFYDFWCAARREARADTKEGTP